jgi:DNA polymerase-1
MLRSIFAARPGHVLCSWDLSQIELRIVAAFSKDEVMTEAFTRGLDLHTNLASKLFGVPYEQVDKASQRSPCKTIHYGLIYGAGGDTLWEEMVAMGVTAFSREDCWHLIRDTWKVYRGAARYLQAQAQEARQTGMARTFAGRRRFLPGCQLVGDRWPLKSLRMEAERQAGNFAVQGGAGEILKQAEAVVWDQVYPAVRKAGHYFRLWLQVHDELFGETTPEALPMVNRLMTDAMQGLSWVTHPIPILTEGVSGANWGALKA